MGAKVEGRSQTAKNSSLPFFEAFSFLLDDGMAVQDRPTNNEASLHNSCKMSDNDREKPSSRKDPRRVHEIPVQNGGNTPSKMRLRGSEKLQKNDQNQKIRLAGHGKMLKYGPMLFLWENA